MHTLVRFIAVFVVMGTLAVPYVSAVDALEPVPIGQFTSDLYTYSLTIVGLAVFIMFLVAGLATMVPALQSSVGKPDAIIKDAVIGLIILVSAYVILNSISPDLVKLPQ